MKGCLRCSLDNLRRSWILFKLSFSYMIQAAKCMVHSKSATNKDNAICTRYSTTKCNVFTCSPSIHFFNIEKSIPYHIAVRSDDDTKLDGCIVGMKHSIKNETLLGKNRSDRLQIMKWLEELQYYRQSTKEPAE